MFTILNWYITSVICFSNTISRLEMCIKILIIVDPAKVLTFGYLKVSRAEVVCNGLCK